MAKRLKAMDQPRYRNAFQVTLQPDALDVPLRWKRPRMIFVNSMSDLFHSSVPDEYISRCLEVMNAASQHTFQVLTKRIERAAALSANLSWSSNIWMGTSIENADYTHRARFLTQIPAVVRFLSIEPLLGPILRLPLNGIHWVIVGGESGPGARPMKAKWVYQIRDRCTRYGVPFFFKQWGGVHKKKNGRLLEDRTWSEMPDLEGSQHGERSVA
jgi:protein gp37